MLKRELLLELNNLSSIEWEIGPDGSSKPSGVPFDPWGTSTSEAAQSHQSEADTIPDGKPNQKNEFTASRDSSNSTQEDLEGKNEQLTPTETNRSPLWVRLLTSPMMIATLLFLLWIGFVYQSSLLTIHQGKKRIHALEKQLTLYDSLVHRDSLRLEQLQTNDANLERFAREQYYMHREDEDVFVIE